MIELIIAIFLNTNKKMKLHVDIYSKQYDLYKILKWNGCIDQTITL